MSTKQTEHALKEVQLIAAPNKEASVQPAIFANALRVSIDPNTATLYFFSLSGDMADGVRDAVKEGRLTPGADGQLTLQLEVPAAAKLAVPVRDLPRFIELMQKQYALWESTRSEKK